MYVSTHINDCCIAPHSMSYKVCNIAMFSLFTQTQCQVLHHSILSVGTQLHIGLVGGVNTECRQTPHYSNCTLDLWVVSMLSVGRLHTIVIAHWTCGWCQY